MIHQIMRPKEETLGKVMHSRVYEGRPASEPHGPAGRRGSERGQVAGL